jgi:hypothetical protein
MSAVEYDSPRIGAVICVCQSVMKRSSTPNAPNPSVTSRSKFAIIAAESHGVPS